MNTSVPHCTTVRGIVRRVTQFHIKEKKKDTFMCNVNTVSC